MDARPTHWPSEAQGTWACLFPRYQVLRWDEEEIHLYRPAYALHPSRYWGWARASSAALVALLVLGSITSRDAWWTDLIHVSLAGLWMAIVYAAYPIWKQMLRRSSTESHRLLWEDATGLLRVHWGSTCRSYPKRYLRSLYIEEMPSTEGGGLRQIQLRSHIGEHTITLIRSDPYPDSLQQDAEQALRLLADELTKRIGRGAHTLPEMRMRGVEESSPLRLLRRAWKFLSGRKTAPEPDQGALPTDMEGT